MLARHNQYLKDHLENVAILTQEHLNKTPYCNLGYILGKTHDLGKEPDEWQHYLQNSLNGISQRKMDHSTAGAQFVFNLYKRGVIGKILSYVIASHHSGLLNSTGNVSLNSRLQKDVIVPNLDLSPIYDVGLLTNPSKFSIQFLIRVLFSALIDADRLDAEKCENINRIREEKYSLEELHNKFFNNIKIMQRNCVNNKINKIRKELYDQCIEKSYMKPGFFTMTIPTGGGKTLSSTAFSFNHSKQNNQDRIIYLAPYLSITEQNAKVLRDFTYKDAILEHHSNFDTTDDWKSSLHCENWDVPLIVTTFIQFFETLFSNRTSKCRKLHNILNSVIIIDEAQQIPLDYLEPCIEVMKELVNNYNCTIVLCTATQPSIYKSKTFNKGIEKITEIVDNPKEYFNILKRVNIEYLGKVSNDELISYMDCNISELIITNTKKEARELGNKINGYVLTTDLCSQHRKDKLEKIRYNLRNGVPCKVVSTSLIEAGVDISFPVVYRAVTGVDSIGQGAGRCNREGELSNLGKVYLYTPENGYPEIGLIKPMAQITEKYLNENRDILSIEVVDEYFKELYTRYSDNLDKKKIIQRLTMGIKNNDINVQFKDISDDFKLIDEHSYTILVPYNQEAVELIAKFKNNQNLKTMRKLQKYSVQVKSYELTHFIEKGIIVEIKEGVYELTNNENYGEMGIEIKEDYYII